MTKSEKVHTPEYEICYEAFSHLLKARKTDGK